MFLLKLLFTLYTLNIKDQVYNNCINELNNLPICLKRLQIRCGITFNNFTTHITKIPFDCVIESNSGYGMKSKKWKDIKINQQ